MSSNVGIVIVSHSPKVAEGAADMVRQMVGDEVQVAWTGGNPAGGLGTIALKSATRFGDVIDFVLKAPLCLNGAADIKNTTFFIGLAAAAAPMHVNAQVAVTGFPSIYAPDVRVPTHSVPPNPPGGL